MNQTAVVRVSAAYRRVFAREAARREARTVGHVDADGGLAGLARGGRAGAEALAATAEEGAVDERLAARLVGLAHVAADADESFIAAERALVAEQAGARRAGRAVGVCDLQAAGAPLRRRERKGGEGEQRLCGSAHRHVPSSEGVVH
eukprot:5661222-Prymnesium_polylepis.1